VVNRPSVPEIITVNSEALQTQIRDLLPSQNGFGSELQATNVITPIIDLTAAAEGSGLPINLQNALAFGSQTAFELTNSTTTLANSPGFYRVTGTGSIRAASGSNQNVSLDLSDGISTKKAWNMFLIAQGGTIIHSENIDLVFWLSAGQSLSASAGSECQIAGSIRQVADSSGTLSNPSGYPL
jgi:hypothetical protein